jgi:hypothetical protein
MIEIRYFYAVRFKDMRFLLTITTCLLFSISSNAQSWIDVGLKGSYGMTQVYNKSIWENRKVVNKLSYGHNYGGKAGWNFNRKYALTLDFLYGSASQVFEFNTEGGSYDEKLVYNQFDLPLLLRVNSQTGSFFEVGPNVAWMSRHRELANGSTEDLKQYFNSTNFGFIVGMGAYMLGSKNTYLTFGARLHIGLSDMISPDGGQNSNAFYPVMNEEVEIEITEYSKTVPVYFTLNLELNHDLGYLSRSKCKRTAFLFF